MRKTLFFLPVLFAAAVLAQEPKAPETPEQLVEKLGHQDYAVREEATKKLIEMGEKAVPALEKATRSDDLEVRIRAGRALRAIRGKKREAVPEKPQEGERPASRATSRAVEIQMRDGKVKVRVRTKVDGEEKVQEYEGESLEQLRKDHPELREALGGFQFRVERGDKPFDGFDMDRFWKDWGKDFDDDFWRDLHEDLERDMQRQRRWLDRIRKQFQRPRLGWDEAEAGGPALGVRARRPQPVLDAQLLLRGQGLVIEAVEKGSLADRLGLERYDILLELNGKPVRGFADVRSVLAERKEGGKLRAKIMRRGEILELETGS